MAKNIIRRWMMDFYSIGYNPEKNPFSICFIIILFPFLLFYWITPFLSNVTIGSDYLIYSFSQQIELLFSLKAGSFPLYVPGFSSGSSSSALTLGQIFHPLSHLASIMPGYWNGRAIEWNSFFKLLSLGITQIVLFLFLQKIRLSLFFSFILSFITVYNLRSIDLFSHGAPLEAYTGHLILCAMIGWYFISPSKRTVPMYIIGATYLLICSGHPQEMYYGLLGAGIFTCVAPFYLSTMVPDSKVNFKIVLRFWLTIGFFLCLGILLSSVYLLPFYFDFISENILRVGQSYAMASRNLDTFFGTLNNFFLPLHSDTKGAFGGSSLILVALVLPSLRLFKVKIPYSIWSIWGLLLFMFLFIQGSRTPVHRFVWEYFPFASSIRVAGRISLIIPFFVMLLLAWVVKAKPVSLRFGRSSVKMFPSTVLAYFALSFLIIYFFWYIAGYNIFSFMQFREYFTYPVGEFMGIHFFWLTFIIAILAINSLILFAIYSVRDGKKMIGIILIMVTIVQLAVVLKYRSAQWIEVKHDSPTLHEILEQKKIKLDYSYFEDLSLQASIVLTHRNNSFIEPYLGKIYTQVIPVADQKDAYERMTQERLPQQVFVEGYQPEKAISVTEGAKDMKDGLVKLIYSSFNRLKFRVHSPAPAFFGLSYPFTGHWRAWVNNEEIHVYRANGAAHAVQIPEGESVVEFRYWSSATFWGMIISCATFALLGLFICFRDLKGLPRIIGIVITLMISIGGFFQWYNSLYTGDNLETEYTWTYTPPEKIPNLAYGKKTWVSPPLPLSCINCGPDFSHTLLVDGDYSTGASFSAQGTVGPSWFLDLNQIKEIKTVVLYESFQNQSINEGPLNMLYELTRYSTKPNQNSSANTRPLEIDLSSDGNKWRNAASVLSPIEHDNPTRIVFEKLQPTRYIRIKASGKSKLTFDEVEVYGK